MSKTWIDHVTEGYFGFSTVPFLVLCVALIFLTGGIILMGGLFTSRIIKSYYQRRAYSLRFQYQKILNKIVVNEMFSEKGAPDAAFEFYMAELRLITGTSNFSRQLLLTQILENKKNLTGNSLKALVKTYYAMLLYKESLKKLKTFRWQEKALGIRETC